MLLSTQLFDRIVGMTGEPGRPTTVLPVGCRRAPEQRQASRMAFGQRTQICRDRGKKAGVWETVLVKDISTKGLGFVCDDAIDAGDTFMLKLIDKDEHAIRIRCKIERCERGGFGNTSFLLGASYQQVIQQQAIQVNDEEADQAGWQDEVPANAAPVAVAQEASEPKGGGAMAMVASFFRAVDPIRVASQWMHKADDFSSAG